MSTTIEPTIPANGEPAQPQGIVTSIQQQMLELQKAIQRQADVIELLRHENAELRAEADMYRKSLATAIQQPFEFTAEEIQALRDKGLSLREVVDELIPPE
ncbi:MAG TPA: hypothetical protein VKS79_11100 [Gemmataceae bacterium]|nr:hypothetical protein [Gemmataceae bacterium]